MKRCLLLSVLLGLLSAAAPVLAAGFILVDDTSWWPGPIPPRPPPPHWPPGPFPPQRYLFAPLELNSVKVETGIKDQLAVTSVDEEFYNPNSSRLEGTFIFPVPKGAHLDKFSMEIDGQQVEAELLAAEKARHIYENIVRKLKDPALLEYSEQDVYKVRIFPIEPHSKKRIRLSSTQVLNSDNGLVSYLLPLSTEKFSSKLVHGVSVRVTLETKRPIKSIYSPSHSVEVKRDGARRAVAGYEATDAPPDRDFALYFAPEPDELGVNLLTHKPPGEDGYFLLLASPGVDVKEKQVVMKDVAFVLDTSGSMAGKKLEQAKKALLFCVENLNDGDRFELLRFSTEVEPLFDKLVEADKGHRAQAEEFVAGLKALGGTAIDDALKKALSLRSNAGARANEGRPFVIIFLTDGMPTIGTTDENQIVSNVERENEGQTRIFCFGIGTDVNTHLLDKITEATRASSQYVLPEEDLEVKLSNFYSKIKAPVLANPELAFTGDIRTSKMYPSPLPDLFKGEQLVLVGRYSGQGASAVQLEGAVNGAVRKFAYDVSFPAQTGENDFIPRLWATRRVGYLLDQIRLHGENAELRDEVTELARRYGIVTPYTAYLIVEDETRRGVPEQTRSLQSFDKDRAVREEAAHTWQSFKVDRGGNAGVANAQVGQALKLADAAAPAAMGAETAFRSRYGLVPSAAGNAPAAMPPNSTENRLVQYSRQFQFVAGKTFFQNEQQWLDSAIQKSPEAKRTRLEFASPAYFDLVAKHPQVAPWLALGQNVQFLFEGVIYEVYPQ